MKWQQRASEQKDNPTATPKTITLAPTLHVKPEKRFHLLDPDEDTDEELTPLRSYRLTMHDPDDDDDTADVTPAHFNDADAAPIAVAPIPATVAAILADVDRRLAHHPRIDNHIVMNTGTLPRTTTLL